MTLSKNTYRLIHYFLLIIVLVSTKSSFGQNVKVADFGLGFPVYYSARDSIVMDVPNQILRLYGEADIKYDDIHLTADLIEVDIEKSEVEATYSTDSIGNPVGKPVFSYGQEEVRCEAMKYNFDTEKAYITEVRTQQGEGYIHMAESKRLPNEEIHFKNGKYTTCDHEKPHYHFQMTKAITVPEKRIVTGPIYMRILNIPVPIAAPFAFLPNSEKRKHGILMPRFAFGAQSFGVQYGTGIEDLGYYIPLSERWETTFYGTIFTSGRWGIRNQTNYNIKYKHSGTFRLGYERLKGYFFEGASTNNYTVYWKHNQHVKAHPSLRFGASIDFRSNNNAKQSLEILPENVFNTAFNSAMNLNKSWKLNRLSGAWTTKVSLQQNSSTNNYIFELPSFNLSVNRFDLGVLRRPSAIGKKWYENIAITYTLNSLNRINAPDSVVNELFSSGDFSQIGEFGLNGLKHNAIVQTNLKPKSGWFTFNLNTNYNEYWNFQSIEKNWNIADEKIDTTFIDGFESSRDINFSGGLATNFYGYFKTNLQSKLKFRHVMSPNITFTYRPDIGAHQQIQIDTLGTMGYYSPFDLSLYRETSRGESGLISFSLANILEMKKLNKRDSINQSFNNFKIIDRFSINGNYDVMKDSLNLSNIRFSLQTSPFKFMNFQSSWTLNPYEWDDQTGETNSTYAWNADKGIGRITNANFAINGRYGKTRDPKTDTLRNFKNTTWNVNFQYNINYSRRNNGIVVQDTFNLDHTIRLNGSVELWQLWNIDYDVMTDLMGLTTTPNPSLRLALRRELHCWESSIEFRKNGNFIKKITNGETPNYSIQFRINIKSSMFNSFLPQQNIRIPGI